MAGTRARLRSVQAYRGRVVTTILSTRRCVTTPSSPRAPSRCPSRPTSLGSSLEFELKRGKYPQKKRRFCLVAICKTTRSFGVYAPIGTIIGGNGPARGTAASWGGSKWSSPRPAIIYGVAYFHLGTPGRHGSRPASEFPRIPPDPHGTTANVVFCGYG